MTLEKFVGQYLVRLGIEDYSVTRSLQGYMITVGEHSAIITDECFLPQYRYIHNADCFWHEDSLKDFKEGYPHSYDEMSWMSPSCDCPREQTDYKPENFISLILQRLCQKYHERNIGERVE